MGPFIHRLDPVIAEVGGVYLWWYGLSYASGFLSLHLWLRRARGRLQLSLADVYRLTLFLVIGVLLGGRLVEVFCYEGPFYREHLTWIPAFWLGGMATHGLLLGGILAAGWFCRQHHRPLLAMLDELVIPGALLMGLGRIGNFIDGQILGSVTDAWWGVKFPDAEGYRHPVVLYDGLKNLLLLPLLLWLRHRNVPRGVLTAHFVLWYGFLRIFVDLFREYPTTLLGLATGQSFNLFMTVAGLALLLWRRRAVAAAGDHRSPAVIADNDARRTAYRLAFAALLVFCATIPSDWTQDIPARYGHRHPGLEYSALYPPLGGKP